MSILKILFLVWLTTIAIFSSFTIYGLSFEPEITTTMTNLLLADFVVGVASFLGFWLLGVIHLFSKKRRQRAFKWLSSSIVVTLVWFLLLIGSVNLFSKNGEVLSVTESGPMSVETMPTSTPSAKPTIKPSVKPQPTSDPWLVEKIDDLTTDSRMPPDSRMATADELFIAINNFRAAHNIPQVQKHETLCRIAQQRTDQFVALGKLDDHEGFRPLAEAQQDFNNMGEIIQGGVQPNFAVHIVEWGWGRSLTGHRESMLDRKWTHGCGGVSGYFSSFEFGTN